jgi:hypothetical protein
VPGQVGEAGHGLCAYDCANVTNRVDAYSLLEPATCPTMEDHYEVEQTIFGETVQMKRDWTIPQYLTFRVPRRVEAQECRAIK